MKRLLLVTLIWVTIVSGCAPKAVQEAVVTEKVVEKAVAETVVVEKVVEKVVEETVIVEVAAEALVPPEDPRVVVVGPRIDQNGDRISDFLVQRFADGTYARPAEGDDRADVLIAFESPPTDNDLRGIQDCDGEVFETWDELVYAIHAALPPDLDHLLSYVDSHPRVIIVEENTPTNIDLEFSTAQIGARRVWSTYGIKGNPDYAIAIVDGGIDDSHTDIPGLRAWANTLDPGEAGAGKASGWDAKGHGTHIAGIAAGRGSEADTADFSVTFSGILPVTEGKGYSAYYPIKIGTARKPITAKLKAKDAGAQYWINIRDSSDSTITGTRGLASPTPLTAVTGALRNKDDQAYKVAFGTRTGDGVNTGGTPYYCQVEIPYDSRDGHNLLSGVAPESQLVGVKVMRDDGTGDSTDLIQGMTWVANNAQKHKIVVANRSGSSNDENASVVAAARTLVSRGVSLVCSAGNRQGTRVVTSPGMAPEALTVGAVSDEDKLAKYSSVGPPGPPLKPDVLAPGGSTVTRNKITSVDTNDNDTCTDPSSGAKHLNPDQYPDDYCMMNGTSMAAPHVAGLVALIADAKGGWTWGTKDNPKKDDPMLAKMIILMTSVEVNAAENNAFQPTLDRGGKDNREGYGRVNADAAIEAVVESMAFTFAAKGRLGSQPLDKKCWARRVSLQRGTDYILSLEVPWAADFDLYLYEPFDIATMPFGEPIIAANSVKAGTGEGEKISLKPGRTGDYYIVVKWVSGDGEFKLLRLPMVKATVRASFLGLPLNTLDIEAPGRAGQKYYVLVAEAPAIDELGGAFGGLRTGLTLYGREAVTEGNLDADGKASVAAGEMSGHKGFMQIIVCPGGAGNCAGGAVSEVIHIEL